MAYKILDLVEGCYFLQSSIFGEYNIAVYNTKASARMAIDTIIHESKILGYTKYKKEYFEIEETGDPVNVIGNIEF